MSDPQVDPNSRQQGTPALGNGGPAPAPEGKWPVNARDAIQAAAESILGPDGDPSDDSPTIISKTPRHDRSEEALAVNLRGQILAHFELVEAIGVGGMAAVIRAHDRQLDRTVALKILPPVMAKDPENIRRFQQEARAAAKLDHENIARVFFCGTDQGLHFIAFEFVEGENLRTILEKRGRLPVPEAINYMLHVASGLAHAAARGVVHRDIKPSNIIIAPNGRAKLVDMGLARSLERRDGDLTQSGVTLGTFDYISPEQALEPREADVRSDIYSLGCTFYHMLTGHPPVPEGTAAKKLQYHRDVPPVDPRQLNGEIPDDVAAILGRMMAKNPRDRYQKPEHLVEHLYMVARKYGVGADLPEGALFLDAPLPNPPHVRPVLLGLAAAAVVVVAVVLLNALTGPTLPVDPPLLKADRHLGPKPGVAQPPATERANGPSERIPTPGPAPTVAARTVRTVAEAAEALKQADANIQLAADFDYKALGETGGLVFDGHKLTLEGESYRDGRLTTLRFAHNPQEAQSSLPWAALTIKSGHVTVRGLRMEIDAFDTNILMAAVSILGDANVTLEDCVFVQKRLPREAAQRNLSHVIVSNSQGLPLVKLSRCLFLGEQSFGGHEAVTLASPADVRAENCAFGPHAALFHVRGTEAKESLVDLHNCSTMLGLTSAVFRLGGGGPCKINAVNCLFAQPPTANQDSEAVLVWQTGDRGGDFAFTGAGRNCYHNLRSFWVKGPQFARPVQTADFLDDFRGLDGVKESPDAVEIWGLNPWQHADPLARLPQDPQEAFQLNLSLPQLRQLQNPDSAAIGSERLAWGPVNPEPWPAVQSMMLPPIKIVDPGARQLQAGVYLGLTQAILDARPGDEILIRHNGPLEVRPIWLEKGDVDLTIRPFRNSRPILTLAQTTEADPAMFRLYDGQLRLDGLQFHLKPSQPTLRSQAVVSLWGNGLCSFQNCVATLEEGQRVQASLLTLIDPDPNLVVRMEPNGPRPLRSAPNVLMKNCFVRGDGDLMTVRTSRRFDLDVDDSLLALEGTFLVVDGNPNSPTPEGRSTLNLRSVTSYLEENLISLRAARGKTGKGLVPTQVATANCLFAAGAGLPLVHLEGMDSDEQMRRLLPWQADQPSAYSGFQMMLDHQQQGEEMALPPWNRDRWSDWTKESGRFTKTRLPTPVSLLKALPGHFKVKPDAPELASYGADVDHLPMPFGENLPEPAAIPED